jgi:hypothetical protein
MANIPLKSQKTQVPSGKKTSSAPGIEKFKETVSRTNFAIADDASLTVADVRSYLNAPNAPSRVIVKIIENKAVITVEGPLNGPRATFFTAVTTPSDLTGSVEGDNAGRIIITGLANNTEYLFKVFAGNQAGLSTNFTSATKKTLSVISRPEKKEPIFKYSYLENIKNERGIEQIGERVNATLIPKNYYEASSVYNRYVKFYEEFLDKTITDEKQILNYQAFTTYKNFPDNFKNENIDQKLKNHIQIEKDKQISSRQFEKIIRNDKYFLQYQEKFLSGDLQFTTESAQNFTNNLYSSETMKAVSTTDVSKNYFPFYNEIKIKFVEKNSFIENIEKLDLENELLFYLYGINNFSNQVIEKNLFFEAKNFKNETSTGSLRYLNDVSTFSNLFLGNISSLERITGSSFDNFIMLNNKNYQEFISKSKNKFFYTIVKSVFNTRTLPKIENEKLTINNDGAVLGFCIEKKDENNNFLQRHIFLNSTKTENFTFIDTQIKYEKQYFYDIFAYAIVNKIIDNKIVNFLTKVKLNENNISLTVVDDPPLAPTFIPILDKNKKNTVKFLIDNTVGTFFEEVVNIGSEQNAKSGYIRFKNDDFPTKFEVYRLETKPTSYNNFSDGVIFTVENQSFFEDVLEPNKNYYYILRAIDVHNNISNPSYVLKIQLVQIEDLYYLDYKTYAGRETSVNPEKRKSWVVYDENELQNKTINSDKSLKKYIQIAPSTQQLLLKNLLQPNDLAVLQDLNTINNSIDKEIFGSEVVTNEEEIETINGRNYKLRIKSKKTGKMIDVHFKFIVSQ